MESGKFNKPDQHKIDFWYCGKWAILKRSVVSAADKIVVNYSKTENSAEQRTIQIAAGSMDGGLAVINITTIIIKTIEISKERNFSVTQILN